MPMMNERNIQHSPSAMLHGKHKKGGFKKGPQAKNQAGRVQAKGGGFGRVGVLSMGGKGK